MELKITRRPLKTRNTRWAASIACWFGNIGLRPNQISVLSVVCAGLSGAFFLWSPFCNSRSAEIACLIATAVFIQLRLLCNLLDGMVAVEGGFRTKSGEIYNDLPDRLSDVLILVPAGHSIQHFAFAPELGWIAGLLAVLTAYVRVLGGSCGVKQNFCGPMAKPHRMAILTIASLLAAAEIWLQWPHRILVIALFVIIVGSLVTVVRRVSMILRELESI